MKDTFLICSLPRSRTLWFSRFLSIPGESVCTHEACEFAASAKEFWANAEQFCKDAGVEIYGNSDSANLFVLPALLAERPLTKVIWVDRPQSEVIASMQVNNIPHDLKSIDMMRRLRDLYVECFDLVVPYHRLGLMELCRRIWEVLMPSVKFDLDRWNEYNKRRIAYGTDNPFPTKDYAKFLEWAQHEHGL
jgi:hypothetical protein